jgi:hypothetical protein
MAETGEVEDEAAPEPGEPPQGIMQLVADLGQNFYNLLQNSNQAITNQETVIAGLQGAIQNLGVRVQTAMDNQAESNGDTAKAIADLSDAVKEMKKKEPNTYLRAPLAAVDDGDMINYRTKSGAKHYENAVTPLFHDNKLFDVEPERFVLFMNLLGARAKDLGFTKPGGIAMIPGDANNPLVNPITDVIKDYGAIDYETMAAYERVSLPLQNRHTQDSKILHDMLMNSLTDKGKTRVTIWKEQYLLQIGNETYESGTCLLKVIVRESYLDSTATISTIRLQISSLDQYIRTNGTDIVAFNAHVRRLMDGLNARQATTHDLLVNLFKAYKACNDKQFLSYVTMIENAHDDNSRPMTVDGLMTQTSNYYKKRITQAEGQWESADPQEQKIEALQAELAKKGGKSNPKKNGERKVTFTKSDAKTPPEWLKKHTKPSVLDESREWNGKTFYWCGKETGGKCGGWRQHKPQACRTNPKFNRKRQGTEPNPPKETKQSRRERSVKMIAAHEAILRQLDTQDSDE